jgi:putative thiamine transport system permease protein
MKSTGMAPVAVLWALPLAASLVAALSGPAAWPALWQHPQLWPGLVLSLWTGTGGLILSLTAALVIVAAIHGTALWQRLASLSGTFLSLPHLAFAIGFGFLIMPSGLLARAIVGGSEPPQWIAAQDPYGLALIACLTLKETPFLIWTIWALMARGDVAAALAGQWRSARSLGHGSLSVWLRVLIPQILPRLVWPLIIVWVYGASVVDMALVIGPTEPPTLAVIVFADLNHADQAINGRGTAGALFLTLVLAAIVCVTLLVLRMLRPLLRVFLARGPSQAALSQTPGMTLLAIFALIYAAVVFVLAIMSVAGHWPFPQLLPEHFKADAWRQLIAAPAPALASVLLAIATSASALVFAILWFETASESLDRFVIFAAIAALGLPALLIAGGQYRLFLALGLTGTAAGLFLAHLAFVFAYVFIMLKDPYRSFDPRYRAVSLGLNTTRLRFWLRIKAPLLKPALLAAGAVGFAVSMAQFVPAQLVAAGRYSTLPMEAVTLASGGNRGLTAVFALALALPPALAFLAAAWFARPRWGRLWI